MKRQKRQKSVTQAETEKPARIRDRVKYRCPEELKRLIDLVNSVPPDRKFPHQKELLNGEDAQAQRNRMEELLEGVPPDFITESGLASGLAYLSYRSFRLLRMALRDLANLALVPVADRPEYLKFENHYEKVWREHPMLPLSDTPGSECVPEKIERRIGPAPEFFEKFKEFGVHFWHHFSPHDGDDTGAFVPVRPAYRVFLSLAEDNKVQAQTADYGLHHLVGIDISRLRVCEDCLRLYWAKQKKSRTCSLQCGNRLRRRESYYRQKQQEYEAARKRKRTRAKQAERGAK